MRFAAILQVTPVANILLYLNGTLDGFGCELLQRLAARSGDQPTRLAYLDHRINVESCSRETSDLLKSFRCGMECSIGWLQRR